MGFAKKYWYLVIARLHYYLLLFCRMISSMYKKLNKFKSAVEKPYISNAL